MRSLLIVSLAAIALAAAGCTEAQREDAGEEGKEAVDAAGSELKEAAENVDLEKAAASDVRVGMTGVREGNTVIVREQDLVPRADLALELFDAGTSAPAAYRAGHALALDTLPPKERDAAIQKAAAEAEGASVKIIAPKVGGVKLKGGKALAVDGQLAGTPSVLFDAVALVLSEEGCAQLLGESAAVDFASNAFVHLKAIGFTAEAQPLLDKANVVPDAGIVDLAGGADAFIPPARTRQWDREPSVRILA